jgi:(1->4)-alpha-D-glucan 1-alpha-D-glucosylmutase
MRIPAATYRLQFHKDFGFADARELIAYLRDLGISDVYASPIYKARAGSMHGYDVVDHSQLDGALGGADEFDKLTSALKVYGMGLILDIVPNHMGIAEPSNAWWMDVLENGPSSSYASYFDIDWQPINPHLENKVLLPILEDQYGNMLEDGKLRLAYEDGAFFIYYYDAKLPVEPRTYSAILSHQIDRLTETLGKDNAHLLELQSILTAIGHLPLRTEAEPKQLEERRGEKEIVKRRIATLYQESAGVRSAIDSAVREFNGNVGDPQSFDLLDQLMDAQPYRLAFWRVAGDEINYRRFFDINELAAICTEMPEVFQATHQLILRLVAEGKVTGLRVDHPDGLRDPAAYFRQLQQSQLDQPSDASSSGNGLSCRPLYIVAEKILSKGEGLPADWAVSGTTGYDFLNQVNGLFVRRASRGTFDKIYGDFIGAKSSYRELVNSRKKMIMLVSLASEINALSHRLDDISERNRHYRDFTLNSLTFAIREVIACLSVYRTYADGAKGEVSERDRRYVEAAVEEAKKRNPRTARAIFDFIGDTLSLKNLGRFLPDDRQAVIDFVMKFQQLTGPVMAKGVEDTAFYVYNRLIALNEVGGDPEEFGISLEAFHRQNSARLKQWPHAMLTLTTHDTKRGEDARARIDALSEIAPEWRAALMRWRKFNDGKKSLVDGELAPDRNDEYLFYQTLVGAWPGGSLYGAEFAGFRERIVAHMEKAIKEAKVHTSWVNPNETYDRAVEKFVREVLVLENSDGFLEDFRQFQQRIAFAGMLNSLAQTLLKMTAPGVPDFYQGSELWDLRLVDPDNRRPVDFVKRKSLLEALRERDANDRASLLPELLSQWQDGRVKLYLIYKTLNFRRHHEELFQRGSYLPLPTDGKFREHVCAFARRLDGRWVVAAAPRLLTRIVTSGCLPLGAAVWEREKLALPARAPMAWRNVLTGETLTALPTKAGRKAVLLREMFRTFPVAFLESEPSSSGLSTRPPDNGPV